MTANADAVPGRGRSTTVALFTPNTSHLRADAVWVTISNWADALAERFGAATVVTPARALSPTEARAVAWSGSGASPARGGAPMRTAEVVARQMVKDVRAFVRGVDARRRVGRTDLSAFTGAPYVWQHHDLFHRHGLAAARRLGLPLVLFVDAPQVWESSRWGVSRPGWGRVVERLSERRMFEAADVVACVSDEVADAVRRIAPRQRSVIVTPCTAQEPTESQREANREMLGLGDRFVLGWVGSFRKFHDADLLVDVAASLADVAQGVTLLMVGDGATRELCEGRAAELGVDARFTGAVPNDDVLGLLQACDAGVLPCRGSGEFHYSPLKLKEYLAAGLPTVAPAVGEMARSMTDGVDSLLYQPGDVARIASLVRRLIDEPETAQRIADAGVARLRADFSMGAQLDEVAGVLSGRGRSESSGEGPNGTNGTNGGRMKVLHVVTDDNRRGAQVFACDLDAAMRAHGVESRVVALAPGAVGGLGVPTFAPKRRHPRAFLEVRRQMAQVDITVAHGSSTVGVCAVAGLGPGRRFVVRQISETTFWAGSESRRRRVHAYMSRAAAVVALAPSAARTLVDYIGLSASRLAVVPNGVPAAAFLDRARVDPAEFGVRPGRLVLGYVGALAPEKGVDLAISALADLPDAELLVIGDGPARAELEALAATVAADRVHFLGSVSEPARPMSALDIVVLPSRGGDSMPAVLIEAGFLGLPAVTTDVGAIADVVVDGETGRVVEPNDEAAFRSALGEMAGDEVARRAAGERARDWCLANFEIDVVAREWERVIENVLSGRAPSVGGRSVG